MTVYVEALAHLDAQRGTDVGVLFVACLLLGDRLRPSSESLGPRRSQDPGLEHRPPERRLLRLDLRQPISAEVVEAERPGQRRPTPTATADSSRLRRGRTFHSEKTTSRCTAGPGGAA